MTPYYQRDGVTESAGGGSVIHHGDCLTILPTIPAGSVDAVVTDPPYGLGFMGKSWDHGVPGVPFWQAICDTMQPGAHLLAFGGTRTFHRMAVAIEDAGFEIKDTLTWLHGQGFPKHKSLLKPAWEPIILARKPGPGVLQIDACRIGESGARNNGRGVHVDRPIYGDFGATERVDYGKGRWPANVCLDEDAAALLDAMSGERKSGKLSNRESRKRQSGFALQGGEWPGDTGGASRFFYVAKASRSERNAGLDGMPEREQEQRYGTVQDARPHTVEGYEYPRKPMANGHPTVKPLALMRWLVRLVTPPGGTVLDPFMGSGTTGIAAALEGLQFIGIEQEAEYIEIAERRIAYWRERGAQAALPLEVIA